MCGLTGFRGGRTAHDRCGAVGLLRSMVRTIDHRGPDHSELWYDQEAGIGLAHNRLAIVELSRAGNQPMMSASGRFVLVFNGEIYNHPDLRETLRRSGSAPAWRGHSDTETLLAAIESWGVERALQESIGMFAFALWDRRDRTLTLARDRLGEKPLYYGHQGSGAERTFLFGSELKALRRHPTFAAEIDKAALTSYMRFGYVPAPRSIYRGIFKLEPGCLAILSDADREVKIVRYWSAAEAIVRGLTQPFAGSGRDAVDQLDELLRDAIGRQMMSDVPLGAFLSGGIDSSTVVALMQALATRPVKTFSIGFHEEAYNEAPHAKAVAAHLKTDHTEMYVSASEAMAVIPNLATIYDEPFADPSQIPTYLVSRLAREKVTVSLSGDAGDELFGGYTRYLVTDRIWNRLKSVPRPLRAATAKAITRFQPSTLDRLSGPFHSLLATIGGGSNVGHKMHKAAGVLASATADELYGGLVSIWPVSQNVVIDGCHEVGPLWQEMRALKGLSDVERMMAVDLVTYLPDDILVKLDRAGMAVSLEGRVPFLDHRVVEFAWSLPHAYKIRKGYTKWILREVLYRYVPRKIIDRPKMGFGLPIGSWLRGPLREWAEDLLSEARLRQHGLLDPVSIQLLWNAHKNGAVDAQYQLWNVLMLQSWMTSQEQG